MEESSSSSAPHFTKTPRRTLVPTPYSSTPEVDEEENNLFLLNNPFTKIESNFFSSLFSPFFKLLSMASDEFFHHQAEEEENKEGTITRVPTRVEKGNGVLLMRRFGFGLLGAVYVGLIMIAVMCLAVIMGVLLVQMWVEEPVILRESVYFDYTEVHPTAVFSLGGLQGVKKKRSSSGSGVVPMGHTIYVSLVLLLPESDFNRRIGMFQVGAEIISTTGKIIAKSSQPCMLQFRSLPIRLVRTFIMGIPLLLGISSETQKITIPILKHMEGNQRTEAIKTILQPRAGTLSLPELYSAEILVSSHLPWRKELVRSWKWTFYVWTSLYVYVMLLVILVCCCKSLFFPQTTRTTHLGRRDWSMEAVKDPSGKVDGKEMPVVSDAMKKWQEIKSRRKALVSQEMFTDQTVGSSASSVTFPREDVTELVEDFDGFGDEESVCL